MGGIFLVSGNLGSSASKLTLISVMPFLIYFVDIPDGVFLVSPHAGLNGASLHLFQGR